MMGDGEMESYLWGRNSRLAGDIGGLEAVVEMTTKTMHKFICDDVGLRAVIRAAIKELRNHNPLHSLLDKANRDAVYGSEIQKFIDEYGDKYDAGWRSHLANRAALEMLAKEMMSAMPDVFTEADAKKIYVEAYNAENVKRNEQPWSAYEYKKSFNYPFGAAGDKK